MSLKLANFYQLYTVVAMTL